jgi:hypothetical protein
METAAKSRREKRQHITAASSRFGGYKPESEQAVRKPADVSSQAVDDMIKAFKRLNPYYSDCHGGKDFGHYMMMAERLEYSAKDVENFSISLADLQEETDFALKTGLFLSALVNLGKEQDYIVHIHHLACCVSCLGYRNTKHLTIEGNTTECGSGMENGSILVEGDAGQWCGLKMRSGIIRVEGDVGDNCGWNMSGGVIVVEGDAGYACGKQMFGGSILVEGNTGEDCGSSMRRGDIRIKGDIKSVAEGLFGGRIYHKDVRIFPERSTLLKIYDTLTFKQGGMG